MLKPMSVPDSTTGVDRTVSLGRVTLQNPTVTASGTCGYATEYAPYADINRFGAFTTKSITVEERPGNPPPRVVETACGLLNAIGLANVGIERFVKEKLPEIRALRIPVFVNVAGHSTQDYVAVCRRLDPLPEIAGLELNVSCPNVADGLTFGTDPKRLGALVAAVRREVRRCLLIVKLSPNVTDITATARAAVDAGAECLSLVNTFVGMAVDADTGRPVLANTTGGLSGPAIKPLALYMVHRVYREVAQTAGIPLIGMGGVQGWRDAVEFMLAGATAVGVGTALYADPTRPIQIAEGLAAYAAKRGLRAVRELTGALEVGDRPLPAALEQ